MIGWIINYVLEGIRKEAPWWDLRYCLGIGLEGLRNIVMDLRVFGVPSEI
jgi:hypothetical protein